MNTNRLAVALTVVNLVLLIVLVVQNRIAASKAIPDILRVRAFELVDEDGHVRAQLNVESEGGVVFRLRDENETIRVKLGASAEGSGLVLINDQTEPGIHILTDQNNSSLTLMKEDGSKEVIVP